MLQALCPSFVNIPCLCVEHSASWCIQTVALLGYETLVQKFYLDHPSKWIMFSNLMFSSCTAMGMSALESRCIIYRYMYIYIYMSFPSDVEVKCCPVLVVLGQTARVGRWFVMWSCLWCRRFLAGIIQLPGIIQLTAQRRLVNPRTPTSVPNLYVQVNEVF